MNWNNRGYGFEIKSSIKLKGCRLNVWNKIINKIGVLLIQGLGNEPQTGDRVERECKNTI
jgi:hypothetical protein